MHSQQRNTAKMACRVSLAVLLALASVVPAAAQTVLTGQHDHNPVPPGNGDGYDASGGVYIVPADATAGPSATFSSNDQSGLYAANEATVTVRGGQFDSNLYYGLNSSQSTVAVTGGQFDKDAFYAALYAHDQSTVTVSGGEFSQDGYGLYGYRSRIVINGGDFASDAEACYGYFADFTITGGRFDDNSDSLVFDNSIAAISGGQSDRNYMGLIVQGTSTVTVTGGEFNSNLYDGIETFDTSDVTVTGGQFAGNPTDFNASGGAIDLYGQFAGLAPGQVETLPPVSQGDGTFVGRLMNETTPAQTFTYFNGTGGAVRLHETAAPEPCQLAALGIGLLGLGGLMLEARKRKPAA